MRPFEAMCSNELDAFRLAIEVRKSTINDLCKAVARASESPGSGDFASASSFQTETVTRSRSIFYVYKGVLINLRLRYYVVPNSSVRLSSTLAGSQIAQNFLTIALVIRLLLSLSRDQARTLFCTSSATRLLALSKSHLLSSRAQITLGASKGGVLGRTGASKRVATGTGASRRATD